MPASAQECAASAVIEADPVIAAAIDLAIAITRFTANASTTVNVLSFVPPSESPDDAMALARMACRERSLAGGCMRIESSKIGLSEVTGKLTGQCETPGT